MKKEIIYCDICKKEDAAAARIPVIFTTDQTEGRSVKPYLSNEEIDICGDCFSIILEGNFLWGEGAQGYNRYEFKGLRELQALKHHRDTTVGLWATDRPDLFTDEEKEKFHLFEVK